MKHSIAGAIGRILGNGNPFATFLAEGLVHLTEKALERALRGVALIAEAWLFAEADSGGERAAFMFLVIGSPTASPLTARRPTPMPKRLREALLVWPHRRRLLPDPRSEN